MNVVFAASECAPYAKSGGLADVMGALPAAIAKLGHKVSVYLPFYTRVRKFPLRASQRSQFAPSRSLFAIPTDSSTS